MNRPLKIILSVAVLFFIFATAFWYLNKDKAPAGEEDVLTFPKDTVTKKDCQVFLLEPKAEGGDEIDIPLDCKFDIGKNALAWKFKIEKNKDDISEIIIKTEKDIPVQTILIDNQFPISEDNPFGDAFFNIAYDVNFDGYKDIRVLSSTGASNMFFDYYLFDPKVQFFKKDKVLIDIPFAQFSEDEKVIDGFAATGANSFTIITYEFRDGKYFKVKEEEINN